MAVKYEITTDDIRKLYDAVNKVKLSKLAEGGYITSDKANPSYTIKDGGYDYFIPAVYTPQYSKTYAKTANGKTETVHAVVAADGTVHVDPEAFTMMMEALGFEQI